MPDLTTPNAPLPYGPHPLPLETAVVSCWRCGGPSQRHVLRTDPCETCVAMLQEIAQRYATRRQEKGETHV